MQEKICETPDRFHATGWIAMQFIAEAAEAAGSTDSAAVGDALRGLTIDTYMGPLTMRANDQKANRDTFWGQIDASDVDGYDAPA